MDLCNIRTNKVALHFCDVTLSAKKPLSEVYPKTPETIGDHLRKKRLDLKLFQKNVAMTIGVDTLTVCNWENNLTTSRLRLLPKVFAFLGYNPVEIKGSTLVERIKQYRIQKGLSLRKLARELDIDPGTLARWERNVEFPRAALKIRVNGFLERLF